MQGFVAFIENDTTKLHYYQKTFLHVLKGPSKLSETNQRLWN